MMFNMDMLQDGKFVSSELSNGTEQLVRYVVSMDGPKIGRELVNRIIVGGNSRLVSRDKIGVILSLLFLLSCGCQITGKEGVTKHGLVNVLDVKSGIQ